MSGITLPSAGGGATIPSAGVLMTDDAGDMYKEFYAADGTQTWENIVTGATTTTRPTGLGVAIEDRVTVLTTSLVTTATNAPAGALLVTVANKGAAAGSFSGVPLAVNETDSVEAPAGTVLPVIAVDGTGTSIKMHVLSLA